MLMEVCIIMKAIQAFGVIDNTEVSENPFTDEERHIVKLCCKIKRAANSNQVIIDKSQHRDSDNLHLFKFIEMCNYTVDEFVLKYLRNLQPFSLQEDLSQKYDKSTVCVISLGFKYNLYIKLDITQFHEIVVSFHEDQIHTHIGKGITDLLIGGSSSHEVGETCIESFKLPWGFKIFSFHTLCKCVQQGVFRCGTTVISDFLIEQSNDFLSQCLGEQDSFLLFDNLKQVSFTSYGESLLNEISLLIDYTATRKVIGDVSFAIVALASRFAQLENLPDYEQYREALIERYSEKVYGNDRALTVLNLYV